jgi:hypothetical protein
MTFVKCETEKYFINYIEIIHYSRQCYGYDDYIFVYAI